MKLFQPLIDRLNAVPPDGDIFHEEWLIPFVSYGIIGVFHRPARNLTVEQLQDDVPRFFELLCENRKRPGPSAPCEYWAVPVYTADGFDQTVIDWVHDHRPRYKYNMWHEPVLYDRALNSAELRTWRESVSKAFNPVLDGVIPAAVEAVARREGHSRVERVNSESVVYRRQPGDPMFYAFHCSSGGRGEIYYPDGKVLWRFGGQGRRREPWPFYGFFWLPDFVVRDTAEQERFRVKRVGRLPLARFVMTENGQPICTIRQRSILLNRYALDFTAGERWTFHMPLFTVFFQGKGETGGEVRVRLVRHDTWYVRIDEGRDTPQLLAALAFIHRERQRCN